MRPAKRRCVRGLLLLACGLSLAVPLAAEVGEPLASFKAAELEYDRNDRDITLIEEEKDGVAPALEVRVSRSRVTRTKEGQPVCRTSAIEKLADGTYRVTVRLRMRGLLHSVGNGISIAIIGKGGGVVTSRIFYPADFTEEDRAQDFHLDFDLHPPLLERMHFESPEIEDFLTSVLGELSRLDPTHVTALRVGIEKNPGQLLPEPPNADGRLKQLLLRVNGAGGVPGREDLRVAISLPSEKTGIGGSRGNSTPFPSLRRLFVEDVRVGKLSESAVTVRELSAQYAWRRPGETQHFTLHLHNRSGSEQTAELRFSILHGLKGRTALPPRQVRMPDGAFHREQIEWPVPANHPLWGQAALVEAVVAGEVVSSARTWFTVHPRNNAVLIHWSDPAGTREGPRWHHPYAAKPNVANHYEFFAPTPYDSAGLVYEEPGKPFPAGNSQKIESIARQKAMADKLARQGVASAFYLEGHGTGRKAWNLYWDEPEKVAYISGYISDEFYLKHVTSWAATAAALAQGKDAKAEYPHLGFVMFNTLYPEVVDRVIQGTIDLMRRVPFNTCRWDNAVPLKAHGRNILGHDLGKTDAELTAISVDNLRRYLKEIRAVHPQFELGFNGGLGELMGKRKDPFDFASARAAVDRDPITKFILTDHGFVMEEAWGHSFEGFNDYKIVCRNYLRACRAESAAYKYAGGHHGHMFRDNGVEYTPDDIYQQLFSLLGGAHLSYVNFGPLPESDYDLGVYAARFGEFFWDPKLRQLEEIADKVEVDTDADLWTAEAGFEKETERGTLLYVLPFINPPVTAKWLENRYGVFPAPVAGPLPVRVAIPEGYSRVASVTHLENSPWPEAKPLAFDAGGDAVEFKLPELITFEVVVVEFSK